MCSLNALVYAFFIFNNVSLIYQEVMCLEMFVYLSLFKTIPKQTSVSVQKFLFG